MEIGDTEKGCKKTCCAIEVRENKAIYYKVRCAALFQDCKVCRITEAGIYLQCCIGRPNGVRTIGRQTIWQQDVWAEKRMRNNIDFKTRELKNKP